jgi:hypothetical protein
MYFICLFLIFTGNYLSEFIGIELLTSFLFLRVFPAVSGAGSELKVRHK